MRYLNFVVGIIMVIAGIGSSLAAQAVAADSMGLSKGSVFDVPAPQVYRYRDAQPGQGKLLPRAYLGAPPQIPHDISEFLPITAQNNMCIACHAMPDLWGKKREKGVATPIPPSHYIDLRNAPGKVAENLINARFNCNLCHVPQANAPALVENTFSPGKTR